MTMAVVEAEESAALLHAQPQPQAQPQAQAQAAVQVRSAVARDEAEEAAIKRGAARPAAANKTWGDFDADVLRKPSIGVDALSSWPSVALFWLMMPLHVAVGVAAGLVPFLGRAVLGLQMSYCQSGVGGGPERRSPLLVPPMVWALFAAAVTMFGRAGGRRFRLWDLLLAAQQQQQQQQQRGGGERGGEGGGDAGDGDAGDAGDATTTTPGWFFFYEGFFVLPYGKVRELCTTATQRRGRWLGATVAMCPEAVPTNLLLFLDGDHHKAVRGALTTHLLSPARYRPRAAELRAVLAPLLPSDADGDGDGATRLAAFVDADGAVDTSLCARLVARAVWFLLFGDAGLLDGAQLETVAAWDAVPKKKQGPFGGLDQLSQPDWPRMAEDGRSLGLPWA